MGRNKRRRKEAPAPQPRTVFEHLAQQTDTRAEDWRYVTKSSHRYRLGYRYWHPGRDLYAKRTTNEPEHEGADS